MNEVQNKTLDLLKIINQLCNENNIVYFVYAGTLLGAVRHAGFIPWDDDIDIVMFRKDYEKFKNVCLHKLNRDKYILQTIDSDPYTNNSWMKLHDKNSSFISGFRRKEAMEGINIDIFPIDNVPDNRIVRWFRGKIIDKINYIYQYRFAKKFETCSFKMKCFRYLIKFIPPLNEKKFKNKYDKYLKKYNKKKTENVVYHSNRKYCRKVVPVKWLEDISYLRFENMNVSVPKEYKKILERLYGKNYMSIPPKEKQISSHGTIIIDCNKSWTEYK